MTTGNLRRLLPKTLRKGLNVPLQLRSGRSSDPERRPRYTSASPYHWPRLPFRWPTHHQASRLPGSRSGLVTPHHPRRRGENYSQRECATNSGEDIGHSRVDESPLMHEYPSIQLEGHLRGSHVRLRWKDHGLETSHRCITTRTRTPKL